MPESLCKRQECQESRLLLSWLQELLTEQASCLTTSILHVSKATCRAVTACHNMPTDCPGWPAAFTVQVTAQNQCTIKRASFGQQARNTHAPLPAIHERNKPRTRLWYHLACKLQHTQRCTGHAQSRFPAAQARTGCGCAPGRPGRSCPRRCRRWHARRSPR